MANVLVLGASRGIGLEFVRQFRGQWDRVTATARDDAGLARLEALGARALRLDVADPAGDRWLVRAPDHDALCDALAAAPRPAERVRVEVDPLRA